MTVDLFGTLIDLINIFLTYNHQSDHMDDGKHAKNK